MKNEYLELINNYGEDTLKRWEESLSLFQADRYQFNRGEFADVFVYRHYFTLDQDALDVLTLIGVCSGTVNLAT